MPKKLCYRRVSTHPLKGCLGKTTLVNSMDVLLGHAMRGGEPNPGCTKQARTYTKTHTHAHMHTYTRTLPCIHAVHTQAPACQLTAPFLLGMMGAGRLPAVARRTKNLKRPNLQPGSNHNLIPGSNSSGGTSGELNHIVAKTYTRHTLFGVCITKS